MWERCLFLGLFVLLVAGAAVFGIAPGEVIQLSKDTPLYFRGTTPFRTGRAGERFKVVEVRPAEHRIYVVTQSAAGQQFIASLGDDAVNQGQAPAVIPTPSAPSAPVASQTPPLPAVYGHRASSLARGAAIMANGGSAQTEQAVLKALRWLVRNQNASGSWGLDTDYRSAEMTGFALLGLLGHGETEQSPEFGAAVQNGIDWVRKLGTSYNGYLNTMQGFVNNASDRVQSPIYSHLVATQALAEHYTLTRDSRDVAPLQQAVPHIIESQVEFGGWAKGTGKYAPGILFISIQAIEALHAARLTGLKFDGLDGALENAAKFLRVLETPDGRFLTVAPPGGVRSMPTLGGFLDGSFQDTGAGLFGMYLAKDDASAAVRTGATAFMQHIKGGLGVSRDKRGSPEELKIVYGVSYTDLEQWYYDAQLTFVVGGAVWQTWNRLMQRELLPNQAADGSWMAMKTHTTDDMQLDDVPGTPWHALYRTNLCVLMLETYYRYGPGQ